MNLLFEKILLYKKNIAIFCFALLISVVIYYFVQARIPIRLMLGVLGCSLILWIFEPLPIYITGILSVSALVIFKIISIKEAFGGFTNSGVLLVIAGLMIGKAINSTQLGNIIIFYVLKILKGSLIKLIIAIIIIPQFLVFLIPSTGVRTVIMLPFILTIIKIHNNDKQVGKALIFALIFGCNLSGLGVLTGAIANIVTVDFINLNINFSISYSKWILLIWPIWFGSVMVSMIILYIIFRKVSINVTKDKMENDYFFQNFRNKEKKCLLILMVVLILWFTQEIHGVHPVIPAILGVVLLITPVFGIINWFEIVKIKWTTVILLATALVLGDSLRISGADKYLADLLLNIKILKIGLENQFFAPIVISFITLLFHLGIATHVSTVAAVLPIALEMANQVGTSSLVLTLTSGVTSLLGLTLIVQAPPAVIAYSTGFFSAKEFALLGTIISIITVFLIGITAFFWWPLNGII